MSFQADLITFLATKAALTALVGARIYPDIAPQPAQRTSHSGGTQPYIVMQKISGPRIRSMTGSSGMARVRFQFDCLATTRLAAIAVAEELRKVLDGYKGSIGSDPTEVQGCFLLDEGDTLDASPDHDAQRMYGVRQDYEIWHDEVKPGAVTVTSVVGLSATSVKFVFSQAVRVLSTSGVGMLVSGDEYEGTISNGIGTSSTQITITGLPNGGSYVGTSWQFDPASVVGLDPGVTGWGRGQSGLVV